MNIKMIIGKGLVFMCLAGLVFLTLPGVVNGADVVPDKAKEAADKIYQAKLRFKSYLDFCAGGFAKYGIEVAGLAEDISRFRKLYEEAREQNKAGKGELAYESINKAEAFYISFYPHIKAARAVVELKDEIEALREVGGLYQKMSKDVSDLKLSALDKDYNQLVKSLKEEDFNIDGKVKSAREKIGRDYAKLDAMSPYNLPVRLGLSQTSFGRFGWCPADAAIGEGLLVNNLKKEPFSIFKEYGDFYFIFKPSWMRTNAAPENVIDKKTDVTWVSYKRQYSCKNPEGAETKWNLFCSLLAPGILLDTNEKTMDLQGKIKGRQGPNKILLPGKTAGQVISLPANGEYNLKEMSENWLLLIWDNEQYEKFSSILLVFEKKPESLQPAQNGESVTLKNSRGLGHIGMVDYAGVVPFDHRQIQDWEKKVPADVMDKCRQLSQVMLTYPVECKEFYMVDKANRQILIRNEVGYYRINDEWDSPKKEFCPAPPILSFVGEKGYPFKPRHELKDFDVATKYGPYQAAAGNILEYEIPIPDFNHRCYLDTKEWFGLTEALLDSLPSCLNTQGKIFILDASSFETGMWMFNLLDKNSQTEMFKEQKKRLDTVLEAKNQPETLQVMTGKPMDNLNLLERVEPFTGKYYRFRPAGFVISREDRPGYIDASWGFDGGWDVVNCHSMFLQYFYYYAKYSGDWDYIRQNWDFLKSLYGICTRINDWANMAISYHELCADTHTDMGPDVLKLLAFIPLTESMGDRESNLLANYITAKNAIAVLSQYAMGEYFRRYSNAPDAKYCFWENGLSEWGLPADFQGTYYFNLWDPKGRGASQGRGGRGGWAWICNTYDGCGGASEILDMRDQYLTGYFKKFLFETYPSHCGNWYDFTESTEEYGESYFTYKNRTEYVRLLFGEPTPVAVTYLDRAFRHTNTVSGEKQYLLPALCVLQGRDAPAYLISWEPNRLIAGSYDWTNNLAKVEISARAAGLIKLKSFMPPVRVTDTIADPKKEKRSEYWQYDPQRQILTVAIGKGEHSLILDYTGWKRGQTNQSGLTGEAPRGKPRGIFAEPSEAKNTIPPCGKPQDFLAKEGKPEEAKKYPVEITFIEKTAAEKPVSTAKTSNVYIPDGDFEGMVDFDLMGEKGPCNRFQPCVVWDIEEGLKANITQEIVHSGKRALHMIGSMHPRPGQSSRTACTCTDIWIEPDRPYTVTFWYNAPKKFEKDHAIFGGWGSDMVTKKPCLPTGCPGFTVPAGETPTSGWKKAEIHVKAPKPGIDMLRITFEIAPPDEIYLDDIAISYDN